MRLALVLGAVAVVVWMLRARNEPEPVDTGWRDLEQVDSV